jgi:hypothetical protein
VLTVTEILENASALVPAPDHVPAPAVRTLESALSLVGVAQMMLCAIACWAIADAPAAASAAISDAVRFDLRDLEPLPQLE